MRAAKRKSPKVNSLGPARAKIAADLFPSKRDEKRREKNFIEAQAINSYFDSQLPAINFHLKLALITSRRMRYGGMEWLLPPGI
jgi:hypothetical protein